jgi:hypothetical protein
MNKMSKFKQFYLLVSLFFGFIIAPPVLAGNIFSDLDDKHWAVPFFTELKTKQIFQGDADTGEIRPDEQLNRAEAITLILRSLGINPEPAAKDSPFKDVLRGDWFYAACIKGNDLNIITGYKDIAGNLTGEFKPVKPVTRAEFVVMIFRAFKFQTLGIKTSFNDISGHWGQDAIETLWGYTIIDGISEFLFDPNRNITRAEAAKVISKALNPSLREEGTGEAADQNSDWLANDKPDVISEAGYGYGYGEEAEQPDQGTSPEPGEGELLPETVQNIVAPGSRYLAANYRVIAEFEPFIISKLTFNIVGSAYDGFFNEIGLYYPTIFESPEILNGMQTGSFTTNQVIFDSMAFAAPENTDVNFPIVFTVNTVDNETETGRTFQLLGTAGNPGEFEAIGRYSRQKKTLATIDNNNVETIIIRKSFPIFEELGEIRTLILSPESVVLQMKVMANASGNISLARLSFEVAAQGLDMTANGLGGLWYLYRTDTSQGIALATSTLIGGKVVFDFPETEIFGSESHLYEVRAPVVADATDSQRALSIRLSEDLNPNADSIHNDNTGILAEVQPNSNQIWSDRSASNHSDLSADWTNGYMVQGLPMTYVTLSN